MKTVKKSGRKYYCELCGKTFHSTPAALECMTTPICRGMNFPPAVVESIWRFRGCTIVLAETAAEALERSIKRYIVECGEKGLYADKKVLKGNEIVARVRKWTARITKSIKATTPIGMGKASRIHNGFVDHIFTHCWDKRSPIKPHHAAKLVEMLINDAIALSEENRSDVFWFETTYPGSTIFSAPHPEWVFNEAISAPLASYVSEMKSLGLLPKHVDEGIISWAESGSGVKIDSRKILSQMLDCVWSDEIRSWNFLKAAIVAIQKFVESVDRSAITSDEMAMDAYISVFDYIFPQEKKSGGNEVSMRLYLINQRHWIVAGNKEEARSVLMRKTGIVAMEIKGMSLDKFYYIPPSDERVRGSEIVSWHKVPAYVAMEK